MTVLHNHSQLWKNGGHAQGSLSRSTLAKFPSYWRAITIWLSLEKKNVMMKVQPCGEALSPVKPLSTDTSTLRSLPGLTLGTSSTSTLSVSSIHNNQEQLLFTVSAESFSDPSNQRNSTSSPRRKVYRKSCRTTKWTRSTRRSFSTTCTLRSCRIWGITSLELSGEFKHSETRDCYLHG